MSLHLSFRTVTIAEIKETAADLGHPWPLPPHVTCMRCGAWFKPTDQTRARYCPEFTCFFFYCTEHEESLPC